MIGMVFLFKYLASFLLTMHAEALVILISCSYLRSLKKVTSPIFASLMLLTPNIFLLDNFLSK